MPTWTRWPTTSPPSPSTCWWTKPVSRRWPQPAPSSAPVAVVSSLALSAGPGENDKPQKLHLPSSTRVLQQLWLTPSIATSRQPVTVCVRARQPPPGRGPRPAAPGRYRTARRHPPSADATGRASLRPVFNLTGTVLHTSLGRAPLAEEAIALMVEASPAPPAPWNMIWPPAGGATGMTWRRPCWPRSSPAATRPLPPRWSATNAAAVLLFLPQCPAQGRVRGFPRRAGGNRRCLPIPDVMRRAQVKLVEIGTTNRTPRPGLRGSHRAQDGAAREAVHTSNYAVTGFTAAVPEAGWRASPRAPDCPSWVDLGSGSLCDFAAYGLPAEPTPQLGPLAAGADIVTFSGDKLLGGPRPASSLSAARDPDREDQENPSRRPCGSGKTTLAASRGDLCGFTATRTGCANALPDASRLLTRPADAIAATGERLLPAVQAAPGAFATASVEPCASQIGGGAAAGGAPCSGGPGTAADGPSPRQGPARPGSGILRPCRFPSSVPSGRRLSPGPALSEEADEIRFLDQLPQLSCHEANHQFSSPWGFAIWSAATVYRDLGWRNPPAAAAVDSSRQRRFRVLRPR